MNIPYRIQGIPCQIEVLDYKFYAGEGRNAPSDEDSRDGFECAYRILDRKGYPANWLAKKITESIEEDIYYHIDMEMGA